MKKVIKALALTGGVLCAVRGLDNRLEITHYTIESSKIPKQFDGYRIVQISDYHCDSMPGLANEIRNEAPDLIVSTGDLVHDRGSYAPALRLTERLVQIAPVYMVTGNHDVWRSDYHKLERELMDLGANMLHNERVFLKRDGAQIALSGIDDPFAVDSDRIAKAVQDALKKLSPYEGYDILLFHRANLLDQVKRHGFELVLAGHMHGGQFRFPGLGGFVSPKSNLSSSSHVFFPKYFGGYYRSDDTDMIVNRGLGNPMIIPRVFNRPELVTITLKHQNK